jgi:hypothetical protein
MPLDRFRDQRLHPHLALAHCLLMGPGCVAAANPLQVVLVDRVRELAPLGAVGTLILERTGVASGGRRLVRSDACSFGVLVRAEMQLLATRAMGIRHGPDPR